MNMRFYQQAKQPKPYNYTQNVKQLVQDGYIHKQKNIKANSYMPDINLSDNQEIVKAGKNTIYYILAIIGLFYLPKILKNLKRIKL